MSTSILKRLFNAFRGHASDLGEKIADSNALTIIDQELRDATRQQEEGKNSLFQIIARVTASKNKVEEAKARLSSLEAKATQAMEAGKDDLALEIATEIARLDNELTSMKKDLATQEQHADKQRAYIKAAQDRLSKAKNIAENAKNEQAILSARKSATESLSSSGSSLGSAMESLDRLRERNERESNALDARESFEAESSGKSLEEKIAAAGLGDAQTSAKDVLARLSKS